MASFPSKFTWGVATAAYQIEGAAKTNGRGLSVWDTFSHTPGKVFEGNHGDTACDHYNRLDEDLDLIKQLGVQAYRFSVSWSRVLPEGTGTINAEGLDFYDRLVDGLTKRGIQPWLTLHHWDLPETLFRKGGWLNRDTVHAFTEYTRILVERLGDRVHAWMPLNEPQVFYGLGHCTGEHAPGLRMPRNQAVVATHHGLLAHGYACEAIRDLAKRDCLTGSANYGEIRLPASDKPEDIEAARAATMTMQDQDLWCFSNTWFADPMIRGSYPDDGLSMLGHHLPAGFERDLETIRQPLDFYGVNIYQAQTVRATESGWETLPHPPGAPRTTFNWPVVPEALYWGPKFLYDRYRLPIVITENGCSGMDWVHTDGTVQDNHRIDFLTRYIGAFERAAADGVEAGGYFHWSLMDNFEWAEGYTKRFGLIHIDFETFQRTPKASYDWYRSVVEANSVRATVAT